MAAATDRGVMLPYQRAWLADEADVKIWEKSRRIGASWAEASDAALIASAREGDDYWYVGYNRDMAREFIDDVAGFARQFDLAAEEVGEEVVEDPGRDILAFKISFASGHRVTALSSRPTNLRGKQGVVCIDEAAFHPDLGELLKAALALLIWGGKVRVLSTHDGVESAFNELVEDARAGRKPYSVHRTTFEEALSAGLYRRICQTQGRAYSQEAEEAWAAEVRDFYGDDAREELNVVPSASGGRYFSRVLIESCTSADIPVKQWSAPERFTQRSPGEREARAHEWCEQELRPLLARAAPELASVLGEDFARIGDLTVLLPAQIEKNLTRRVLFAVELGRIPFEQQRQVLFYIGDRLPRLRHMALDAGGNGAYLAEVAMQRYGSARVSEVKLAQSFYLEHFPRYRAALQDRQVLLPADTGVVDDHLDVVRERGVPKVPAGGRRRGARGEQRHGDAAIAGLMMYYASEQNGAPIDFETLGPRETAARLKTFAEGPASRRSFGDDGTTDRGWGTVRGPLSGGPLSGGPLSGGALDGKRAGFG